MLQATFAILIPFADAGVAGPATGDHGAAAWVIAGGYAAAALLCARRLSIVFALGRVRERTRALALWCLLAVGLAALAVNKQLDLHTALTRFGRIIASEQGWYAERRIIQAAFVAALAGVLAVAAVGIATRLPRASRRARLALLGAAFLAGFVVMRAASLHHVDAMLNVSLGGPRLSLVLELGGALCIGLAAIGVPRRRRAGLAPRDARVMTP